MHAAVYDTGYRLWLVVKALDGDFEDKIMLAKDILHVAGSSRNKKLNLLGPTQLPPTTETNDNSTLTQ